MDAVTKATIVKTLGDGLTSLIKVRMAKPSKSSTLVPEVPTTVEATAAVISTTSPRIALPTSEETTIELKDRLLSELSNAESDLVRGLKIFGKPCDCMLVKHPYILKGKAEELISQDPDNPVYQDIINWIKQNKSKCSPEAIHSGVYAAEYPHMAHEFKVFRKRITGTSALTLAREPSQVITLDQAKRLAAEQATQEVERKWDSQEKK